MRHYALAGVCIAAFFLPGCTPPLGSSRCAWRPAVAAVPFEGRTITASELMLSSGGRTYKLRADMVWRDGGEFVCDVFGPFGTLIATVEADDRGGEVVAGGRTYRFTRHQMVGKIEGLSRIPFTFDELIRIFQGRYAAQLTPATPPDTVQIDGRRAYLRWTQDGAAVSVTLKGSDCAVERISAVAADSSWHAQFQDIEEGMARYIRFGESEENYFVLRHRKVVHGD